MSNAGFTIRNFDSQCATEPEWIALNEFQNSIRAEQWPDDPPETVGTQRIRLQSMPPSIAFYMSTAWDADGKRIIGSAEASVRHTEDNKHMVWSSISVLAAFRRRGIGSRLLNELADIALKEDRTMIMGVTDSRVPSGEPFMRSIGARVGITSSESQLNIAELDRDLIKTWQERAKERASGFELGLWEGPYPETEIESIVELIQVMNTAPRDSLEVEDETPTAEHIRQGEASMAEQGIERWAIYAREVGTGALAGFTEVYWERSQPEKLQQGDTGVFPKYRNRGLGRWLKAAMMENVLLERPQVRYVRTGNAASNDAMLKINCQMGFKPYATYLIWQVETEQVLKYLVSKGMK